MKKSDQKRFDEIKSRIGNNFAGVTPTLDAAFLRDKLDEAQAELSETRRRARIAENRACTLEGYLSKAIKDRAEMHDDWEKMAEQDMDVALNQCFRKEAEAELAKVKELLLGDALREKVVATIRDDNRCDETCGCCITLHAGIEQFQQAAKEVLEKK